MRLRQTELFGATAIAGSALILFACSGGEDYPTYSTGGASNPPANTGGNAATTGGAATTTGGTTGGFAPSTGGTSTGGFSTGGTTGGFSTGGFSTGGSNGNTGGKASTGGKSGFGTGGTGTGGSGGKAGTGGKSGTGGSGGKSGTGGSGGSGGAGTVAFSQVASYVRSKCGTCHSGTRMPTLNSTDATTLYNTLTTVTVSRCANNKLVTASDPSKSALLMVSTGQCGTLRMPSGCTSTAQCISTSDQTLLTTWIQSGAKNQ